MAAAAPAFEDSMAQRLKACTGCHGRDGRAAPDGYHPRIAGKPEGYLFRQLRAFRDGQRRYAPMARLLAPLDDAYLQEIARHFARLELPPATRPVAPPQPSAARERAEALVRRGDPAAGVPACTACHGDTLTGAGNDVPGLLGLSADYLNAQLGAWRLGARQAAAPDCMATVARRLAPADVPALSHWLAAQPSPASPRAAAVGRAPLDCGSLGAPARAGPP
jgi:cytochrome c553